VTAGKQRRRCLVLGYDRTESGRRAAEWAAQDLAPDGLLVIVHASRPQHTPPDPLATPHERSELGRAMIDELLLEGSGALNAIEVVTEVHDDDPVKSLLDAVARHDASAIVLGTEHHSRLRRALGVVSDDLLKASPVPVITVPDGVSISAG
jgi:nucleotide-binding universal stress UspA family protein